MILHVLPGDATVETFQSAEIEGEIAVCRECLIEGDVSGETLPKFWENRHQFLESAYPESSFSYHENVVREFAKLTALQSGSEINLWFEYELFCQTNMWFCLYLLRDSTAEIYRVAPTVRTGDEVWKGFGSLEASELKTCFAARSKFTPDDIKRGSNLWNAYKSGDHAKLKLLGESNLTCFRYLREVCEAEMEKDTRPIKILKEIVNGEKDFKEIFPAFVERAGVYGFGDAQVKRILQNLQ